MRFVWYEGTHTSWSVTRENRCTRRRHGRATQGRRTVGGVDDTPLWRRHATQQPIHQTTHTADTAKHTKGSETDMSADTPRALKVLHILYRYK